MVAKITILTLLIAGISVSIALPKVREKEIEILVIPDLPENYELPEILELPEIPELSEIPELLEITKSPPPKAWTENQENPHFGFLTVIVKDARGLDDTDGLWNLPDPYAVVDAYYMQDGTYKRSTNQTSVVDSTQNPSWRETMKFGWANWIDFTIRVMDSDLVGRDDEMMDAFTINISPGIHCTQVYDSNGDGSVTYDYFFQTNEKASCNRVVPTSKN